MSIVTAKVMITGNDPKAIVTVTYCLGAVVTKMGTAVATTDRAIVTGVGVAS